MSEEPVDLSPLGRRAEQDWEALARRIEAAAAAGLARRARPEPVGALDYLDRHRHWLVAAALVLAAGASLALVTRSTETDLRTAALSALTGVSYESANALADSPPPTVGQLILDRGPER